MSRRRSGHEAGKEYADWDTPLDGELEPVGVRLRRDAGQIYVAILTKSGDDEDA